jgi:hypothetical protein
VKYQPPFDPGFAGPVNGVYNPDPDAAYVNGNPATGEEGSIPPMEALAHPLRELVHLITHAGLTPSHTDLEQVRKAVKAMIEAAVVSNAVTGGGITIYEGLEAVTGHHKIRPLVAGSNVSIDLVEEPSGSGRYQVRISATGAGGGGGGGTPIVNIGSGADVYKGLNGGNDEIRRLKGANGITVVQNTNDITVDGAGLGLAPFFPEVETADNKLAVTAATGSVVVAEGQTFVHRGTRRIATSDTLLANRTFSTSANKTYHLRWRWNNGSPAYGLFDTADAGYHGGNIFETSNGFDTKYDDMLIARVVTNGSNVPTVTPLVNRHQLLTSIQLSAELGGTPNNTRTADVSWPSLNWARRPVLHPARTTCTVGPVNTDGAGEFTGSATHDHDESIQITSYSRYGFGFTVLRDYMRTIEITVLAQA